MCRLKKRKEEYESKVDTDINYSEIRSDMEYSVIEMNGYDDIYISYDTSKGKDKFRVYSFDNDTFINAYKRLSSGSFFTFSHTIRPICPAAPLTITFIAISRSTPHFSLIQAAFLCWHLPLDTTVNADNSHRIP